MNIRYGFAVLSIASTVIFSGCSAATDAATGEAESTTGELAEVKPTMTLTAAQRAHIASQIDPVAANAMVEAYRANPEAFRDVVARPIPAGEAASQDGVGQSTQAISWSCRLANYGNPLWWELVIAIEVAQSSFGLTYGNCNWIVGSAATLADWYGFPFAPLAGWSGRCACTYVYE